jgi:hypothetical protein
MFYNEIYKLYKIIIVKDEANTFKNEECRKINLGNRYNNVDI